MRPGSAWKSSMGAAEAVPVIAIDGPAGFGKGTVSHRVAAAPGFALLDGGALADAAGLRVEVVDGRG